MDLKQVIDPGTRPQRCVIIAVDGARRDYLERSDSPAQRSLVERGVGFRNAIASNGLAETANGFSTIATGVTTSGPGIKKLGWFGEPLDLDSDQLLTEEEVAGIPEHKDVAPLMLELFGVPQVGVTQAAGGTARA